MLIHVSVHDGRLALKGPERLDGVRHGKTKVKVRSLTNESRNVSKFTQVLIDRLSTRAKHNKLFTRAEKPPVLLGIFKEKPSDVLRKEELGTGKDRKPVPGPLNLLLRIDKHNLRLEQTLVKDGLAFGRVIAVVPVPPKKLS